MNNRNNLKKRKYNALHKNHKSIPSPHNTNSYLITEDENFRRHLSLHLNNQCVE